LSSALAAGGLRTRHSPVVVPSLKSRRGAGGCFSTVVTAPVDEANVKGEQTGLTFHNLSFDE
jgi:hypothetical protein